jgi:lipoprotein-anchoring transpeptidase ErfK/SrfK
MNAFRLILCTGFVISGILASDLLAAELPKTDPVGMKPASELLKTQEPGKVFPAVLAKASTQPLAIVVSLSKQRAYLLVGGKVAVDSPISSGRRNGWTPKGNFAVLEKDPNHHSSLYGNFLDSAGRVIRSGVSSRIDAAPSGTHFSGAPMKFFMRLTPQGVGMHVGILPGYPASHGCIRLPQDMAEIIYTNVGLNTPVTVGD